jgi:glucokinase
MSRDIAIAIDIGGTKIRGAAIDQNGVVIVGNRFPTAAKNGAAHVLDAISQSIEALSQELGARRSDVVGLGISSAGVIEPSTGQVVNAADQIPGWKGIKLGEMYQQKFGWPTFVDNDANCALVGEAWMGKHAINPSGTTLMLTLGTGLGGAIMVSNCLHAGHHYLAGHFGLAKMWDPYAATLVTVEQLVSGTGLGNVYQQRHPQHPSTTGEAVMSLLAAGDKLAAEALDAWLEHLTLQVHNLYWMIDPDLIIIGGGVTDAAAQWWSAFLQKTIKQKIATPLVVATLGNDAGVYGAAKIVFDKLALR